MQCIILDYCKSRASQRAQSATKTSRFRYRIKSVTKPQSFKDILKLMNIKDLQCFHSELNKTYSSIHQADFLLFALNLIVSTWNITAHKNKDLWVAQQQLIRVCTTVNYVHQNQLHLSWCGCSTDRLPILSPSAKNTETLNNRRVSL